MKKAFVTNKQTPLYIGRGFYQEYYISNISIHQIYIALLRHYGKDLIVQSNNFFDYLVIAQNDITQECVCLRKENNNHILLAPRLMADLIVKLHNDRIENIKNRQLRLF